MQHYEGQLNGKGVSVGVVVARFNEVVTDKLLEGALDMLKRLNAEAPVVVSVPGAMELPIAVQTLFKRNPRLDAVIALGCVIRGETPHFEYVCSTSASGLQRVQLDTGKPVVFGVLTTDTVDQAMNRAGLKAGNKGAEAAQTAVEMVNVLRLF